LSFSGSGIVPVLTANSLEQVCSVGGTTEIGERFGFSTNAGDVRQGPQVIPFTSRRTQEKEKDAAGRVVITAEIDRVIQARHCNKGLIDAIDHGVWKSDALWRCGGTAFFALEQGVEKVGRIYARMLVGNLSAEVPQYIIT
jgi:hypothetical protein